MAFFTSAKAFRLLGILLLGLFGQFFLRRIVKAVVTELAEDHDLGEARRKRVDTLGSVVRSVGTVAVWSLVLLTVLSELGINITPLITGAGIVGFAVSFGAQSLVKDFLSGFFILLENQFNVGDEVEIAGKKGRVRELRLRSTVIDDEDGRRHIIPNSKIDVVTLR